MISADDVDFKVTNDILNQGTIIAGDTAKITAANINNNNGTITGSNVVLDALQDINNNGGILTAQNNLQLTAGRDINIDSITSTQTNDQGHTTNISAIGSVKVTGNDGSLVMSAGRDVNLTAASVENVGSGTTDIIAKNNINLGTVNISESHDLVLDADNQRHDNASMDIGTGINTKGSLNLQAGNDFNAKAAAVQSEDDLNVSAGGNINIVAGRSTANAVDDRKDVGKSGGGNTQLTYTHSETHENNTIGSSFSGKNINLDAGKGANVVSGNITSDGSVKITASENINITGSEQTVSSLNTMDKKKSGMFGSERKKVYDAGEAVLQAASTISGGSVDLTSGKDTNITASNVVADNDVNITAGGNVNIIAAEDTSSSTYKKQVKKSGLLSGGGLGFTIGSEKRKDQYDNQNVEQAGSTVGSIKGSVNVEAGKDVSISASDVLAGKDINLTGQNVTIESADNTYNTQEKHEYKKTGITVSLGGQTVEAVQKITDPIQRATEVKDEKLKALYELNTLHDLQKNVNNISNTLDNIDAKDESAAFKISIGIGSASSKSKLESEVTVAKGSNVAAGGDITVTATEKDINIKGSNVSGENVTLDAKENINITSSENSTNNEFDASNKSFGASVDFGVSGIIGGGINYGKGSSTVDSDGTTHTNANITANKDLTITSGEDVNIKGGKVSGDKVTAEIGGNLNVESQQDTDNYTAKDKNFGIDIGIDKKPQGSGIAFGKDTTDTDSKYSSVTDQSGIYAGEGGFDITVDKNTGLKGGIIDSDATPDKNKLTTGTLTWEDVENEAEYSSKSDGFSGSISQNKDKNGKVHTNTVGGPETGGEVSDEDSSTTKSGVAEGTIEITDKENQKQNIEDLNRDTKNTLNSLGKIFDEQEVQERREMANLFSQMAHSAIGDMTLKLTSEQKAMLNIAAGALTSYFASGDFLSGAAGVATTEALQNILRDVKDPTVKQLIVSIAASAASKLAKLNSHNSVASALDVEKFNHLTHEQQENFVRDFGKAESNKEKFDVLVKYFELSEENRAKDPAAAEAMEKALINELAQITKFDNGGVSFVVDPDKGLHQNLADAKEFLYLSKYLTKVLPETTKDLFVEAGKITLETANVMSSGTIQVIETGTNIVRDYDPEDLPQDMLNKIIKESGKGYLVYQVHATAESAGIPKAYIISADVGFIIIKNFAN